MTIIDYQQKKILYRGINCLEIKNKKLLGYQCHRQVPMLDYIADFYCHELMLAIEIDGDSHSSEGAKSYDLKRQQKLEAKGVHFIRFDDAEMKGDINGALRIIKTWIMEQELTTPLPPLKGYSVHTSFLSLKIVSPERA